MTWLPYVVCWVVSGLLYFSSTFIYLFCLLWNNKGHRNTFADISFQWRDSPMWYVEWSQDYCTSVLHLFIYFVVYFVCYEIIKVTGPLPSWHYIPVSMWLPYVVCWVVSGLLQFYIYLFIYLFCCLFCLLWNNKGHGNTFHILSGFRDYI